MAEVIIGGVEINEKMDKKGIKSRAMFINLAHFLFNFIFLMSTLT